jgi:hypothetical protein
MLDPVRAGIVTALTDRGGNVTGMPVLFCISGGKRLELQQDRAPSTTIFGVLVKAVSPDISAQSKVCAIA